MTLQPITPSEMLCQVMCDLVALEDCYAALDTVKGKMSIEVYSDYLIILNRKRLSGEQFVWRVLQTSGALN